MLANLGDIKTDVLVKLNTSTTVAFYSETIINNWINQAYLYTAGYKKWPFTERRDNTTSFSTEENSYPSDFRTDSIRLLQVGGERLQKLNFEDYQIYREENPTGTEKVYSDFGRTFFINPYAGVTGTITAWGQYAVADLDTTDNTATTVFSAGEEDGNSAIVEEVLSYAKLRESKPSEAKFHHERCLEILSNIWERHQAEQFAYHTKDRGMFERLDVLRGGMRDDLFNENRFY